MLSVGDGKAVARTAKCVATSQPAARRRFVRVRRSMRNSARCAAATAILIVGLGLAGVDAHAGPIRFPCPPNTPRGMDCDNPQPLPPPFAPAAPAPRVQAPGQTYDNSPPGGGAPGGG